jgi:hypothetical protein
MRITGKLRKAFERALNLCQGAHVEEETRSNVVRPDARALRDALRNAFQRAPCTRAGRPASIITQPAAHARSKNQRCDNFALTNRDSGARSWR